MTSLINEALKQKNTLITKMNSVVLATLDDKNLPNSSYAPCFVDENNHFYIYISSLSKHTKNLILNKNVSFMIIEDESDAENIFGRKRLTIDAFAQKIVRDSDNWNQIMDCMEKKFGNTLTYLKKMTDFNLFKLVPRQGLLVYGFARAFKFMDEKLETVDHLNDQGHSQK